MRRVGVCGRVLGSTAGRVAIALSLFLLILCSAPAIAGGGEAAATSPPHLVYAGTDLWRTDLLIESTGQSATVSYVNCWEAFFRETVGPERPYAIVRDLASMQCAPKPAGLAPLRIDGSARVTVLARFYDGSTGDVASFAIPPLEHAMPAFRLRGSGIQSDAEYVTSIVLFNESADEALITASVRDANGVKAGEEVIAVRAGDFVLYQLVTEVDVGSVELTPGIPDFGCPGCDATGPVYGFAVVTWRAGGSPRVVPLEPITAPPAP